MPVKIRLTRRGRKKHAMYDVVVADSRSPRDGKFIEKIGTYDPNTDPASISLNDEKAFDWVMKGAQPTDTVRAMLSYRGILMKKHLQIGVIKGALTQEEADKKFEAWVQDKEAKIQGKRDKLSKAQQDEAQKRLAAEKKVSDARAKAIADKKKVVEETLVAEVAEASKDEAEKELEDEANEAVAAAETKAEVKEAPEAEKKEEAPKAEEKKEEAPKAEEKKEETPKAEEKKEEAPKAEENKEEAPKAEEKKEDAPKAEEKKEDAPKAEVKKEESSDEEKKEG